MRILVFEYVTGGGLRDVGLPPSLFREGERMLRALVADLVAVAGVRVQIMRDDRLDLEPLRQQGVTVTSVSAQRDPETIWLELLASCDAAWPIAPETGGVLERLCRQVIDAGKRLLNSDPDTVGLATRKDATLHWLKQTGIPVTPCYRWAETPTDLPFPRVIKPNDGAGCEKLQVVRDSAQWPKEAPAETIVQPYLEGDALSLSALFCDGTARLLSCNRQMLVERDGTLALTGCQVNAIADHDGSWQDLADAVALALPGLWGYAGIDLIATTDGPCVLEVNPRLTTSYAGLHAATGINPAALIVQMLEHNRLPSRVGPAGRQIDVLLDACHDH